MSNDDVLVGLTPTSIAVVIACIELSINSWLSNPVWGNDKAFDNIEMLYELKDFFQDIYEDLQNEI